MYTNDNRIVATLDAGGTNLVFGAMRGGKYITDPVTLPSRADDLQACLGQMTEGFNQVINSLPERPVAISFAFPGPADYPSGVIGGFLPNFPSFREGVALGPYLESRFGVPVFINNDGDLYAYGEGAGGALPDINARVAEAGGQKQYRNLIGFTFGTGLGIGEYIDGRLNLGNNSCVEAFCLTHPEKRDIIAEEGASIRAITREYAALSGDNDTSLTPYDIFLIADGQRPGNAEAARRAFEMFGRVVGDVAATAVTLLDALVVVGGGLTGAMKYIRPAMLREMRSEIHTLSGETLNRVQMRVFDLDDPAEFRTFALGEQRELTVPGTDRRVAYDPMKRTGVATSRLGASQAIQLGAYAYALSRL